MLASHRSRERFVLVFTIVIVWLMLALPAVAVATSGDAIVLMETATIRNGNSSAAREHAIARSLQTAVRREICRLMAADALTYHFKSVNEIVARRIDRFIETYKVLTESTDGNRYSILVEVRVATKTLQQALSAGGIRQDNKGLPTVLVMIAETLPDDTAPRYGWGEGMATVRIFSEEAVSRHLRATGYKVLLARDLTSGGGLLPLRGNPFPEASDVLGVARKAGAGVVILGRSDTTILPNQMGTDIKSFRGETRLRAFKGDDPVAFTEAYLDAVTTDADVYNGSVSALTAAGRSTGEEIARQIAAAWRREQTSREMMTITVEGTSYLSSFVRFRRTLRGMPGVKRLQVREMKSNRATLEAEYAGSPQELADALMLQAFDSFGLIIHEVLPEGLTIGLHTGQPPADEGPATSGGSNGGAQPPANRDKDADSGKIEN